MRNHGPEPENSAEKGHLEKPAYKGVSNSCRQCPYRRYGDRHGIGKDRLGEDMEDLGRMTMPMFYGKCKN